MADIASTEEASLARKTVYDLLNQADDEIHFHDILILNQMPRYWAANLGNETIRIQRIVFVTTERFETITNDKKITALMLGGGAKKILAIYYE